MSDHPLKYFRREFQTWLQANAAINAFSSEVYFRAGDEDADADTAPAPIPATLLTILTHGNKVAAVDTLFETSVQVDFFSKTLLDTIEMGDTLWQYASNKNGALPRFNSTVVKTQTIRPGQFYRAGVVAAQDERGVYVTTLSVIVSWTFTAP